MATLAEPFERLAAGYLFPEIERRKQHYQNEHPGISLFNLGIGNTTQPLPKSIIEGLHRGVEKLAHQDTYTGYGDGQGNRLLREALAKRYHSYPAHVEPDEIFISDGAKPDSGNIQSIFGSSNVVAVQDPAYPVYVDSNVMAGRTGSFSNGCYQGLVYMPCNESNGFFSPPPAQKVDLLYVCSPNNPTGAVATREQLQDFITYAQKHRAVLIFDAAYASFITDFKYPRSIFELEGARSCAIEINSFSKEAGFTGVRLGWTVVPKDLIIEHTEPGKVHRFWKRRQDTLFNGASNIVQEGGISILTGEGQRECKEVIRYYMDNAAIIRKGLVEVGITTFGGDNAPYIWLKTPRNLTSWEFFDELMQKAHVIGTPGSGFGPSGEGYFRLSAFGKRSQTEEAISSIQKHIVL